MHGVDVGHRRRDVGQHRRSGDAGERAPVETEGGEPRPLDEVVDAHGAVPAHREQAEARGDQHDRRAVDAEVQAEDEEGIEAGGDDRAGERGVHRALGVADAAQDRGEGHADAQEHRGRQDHAQVGRAHRQRLAARAEEREDLVGERHRGEAEDARDRGGEQQSRGGDAPGTGAIAGTERARYQRAERDRHADVHRDQQEDHLRGVADRRREVGVAQPRDVEQGEEVDEEHRDQTGRARRRHHQHVAQRGPPGEGAEILTGNGDERGRAGASRVRGARCDVHRRASTLRRGRRTQERSRAWITLMRRMTTVTTRMVTKQKVTTRTIMPGTAMAGSATPTRLRRSAQPSRSPWPSTL